MVGRIKKNVTVHQLYVFVITMVQPTDHQRWENVIVYLGLVKNVIVYLIYIYLETCRRGGSGCIAETFGFATHNWI